MVTSCRPGYPKTSSQQRPGLQACGSRSLGQQRPTAQEAQLDQAHAAKLTQWGYAAQLVACECLSLLSSGEADGSPRHRQMLCNSPQVDSVT